MQARETAMHDCTTECHVNADTYIPFLFHQILYSLDEQLMDDTSLCWKAELMEMKMRVPGSAGAQIQRCSMSCINKVALSMFALETSNCHFMVPLSTSSTIFRTTNWQLP